MTVGLKAREEFMERYSRQIVLWDRGIGDQLRLRRGSVAVVGCGAIGTIVAELLVRAGVGRVKIIDRDVVDRTNLHRQVLFDERDAERMVPKAVAAAEKLKLINSDVDLVPLVMDVNSMNVLDILRDVDVVVDATDNFETRFLINDACFKLGKPWIYGAVIRTYGMLMSIIPSETPCLRCVVPNPPTPGSLPTCETAGVINTIATVVGSLQATEAMKMLMDYEAEKGLLLYLDVWNLSFRKLKVKKRKGCPTCDLGRFDFLERGETRAQTLCGNNAVQIVSRKNVRLDLQELATKLSKIGEVMYNGYILRFDDGKFELIIFPDGRAIVKGTNDPGLARSIYSRYLGG